MRALPFIAICLFIAFDSNAQSVKRFQIPLMQPKQLVSKGYQSSIQKRQPARRRTRIRSRRRYSPRRRASLSVQAAVLSQRASSGDALLGINANMGARVAAAYPLGRSFSLEPLVGYYFDSHSLGAVSFTQHWLETGANLLYIVRHSYRTQFRLGIAGRVDARLNRVKALESSSGGALQIGLRGGPVAGIATRIGRKTQLIGQIEWTFDFTREFSMHPGLTLGIAFPL